ncbi:MAG: hypoxanthine phosphoribosyltransferase [Candidatus Palauibacterales bacterium]|nr:hypoxanthine phosphoribosyltransferase [Candidatus Palauibacterales bacterium]MDP2530767.1 hypoxanthine phosphoribosyltransferase [Candidatus Palauibacterales bacterium]MDP2582713.1 hypoxanthine phosphoribosyltransferase [Candidatus Palauibacterales bacterium]
MPDVASGTGAERSRAGGHRPWHVVYAADRISGRVRALGAQITSEYPAGTTLLMLGLLKGSFIFMADLVRCIGLPVHVDFLVVSSYGGGTTSSGRVDTLYEANTLIEGRHVVLVEDIVDSGHTINELVPSLRAREPASLEVCALLHKRKAERLALEPRWVGFEAPDEFLVGYGLDRAEDFRHLPFIASL